MDNAGPCMAHEECCTKYCSHFYICGPNSKGKYIPISDKLSVFSLLLLFLESENVKECIPDYAGPCYANDECCTENCSNFICRPPGMYIYEFQNDYSYHSIQTLSCR